MDDAFEDAAAFGTGYALYRHGQDRLTAGIHQAVRAALAEWDPDVLARGGPDDPGAPSARHEAVVTVDLAHYELLDDWDCYIGQDQQMEEFRLRVDSARVRHGRLPHTLLISQRSGMGRRAAVRLAARHLGKRLVELCAPFTIDQLAQAVDHLGYADILFIEDLDMARGPGVGAGTLASVFERGDVLHPRGSSHFVDEISIVASTTRPDDVPTSLLDRFAVHLEMAHYSMSERARLAVDFAYRHRIDDLLSDEVAVEIARFSSGAGPAAVERLVLLARDLAVTLGRPPEAEELARHAVRQPV